MLHRRLTRTADDVPRHPLFSPTQLAADNPTISLSSLSPTIASPPAVPRYKSKVSFDTFENTAASMFSFTLQVKSDGYKRSRNTRLFLCAASPDESGREVLDWSLESVMNSSYVFTGIDKARPHEIIRDDTRELMRYIQEKSVEYDPERKLSFVLQYIAGKITESLDHLVALYRPDSLVVGSRGRRWHGHRRGEHQPLLSLTFASTCCSCPPRTEKRLNNAKQTRIEGSTLNSGLTPSSTGRGIIMITHFFAFVLTMYH